MKILCVEDDINLGQLLKITLAKDSYQVELAENGQIGYELAKKLAYDLIILDLLLPKINGIELCKLLRSEKSVDIHHNRYTPIILMTALDSVTNKVVGLDAGADDISTAVSR
ncbi:response regulator [Nostoc sphaeroides CHAB 2801]|uniref:response regulator n=1 Tax=Nostoc sphaeroides TaxID=446679 RepID=UPI001E33C157|nr:response regulator [Nostoc sphaeroides]MCC5632569.1 response regulator [Nostoc sphaeroides CHAB 2801]